LSAPNAKGEIIRAAKIKRRRRRVWNSKNIVLTAVNTLYIKKCVEV
jgi:hypothetical protein